LDEEKNILPAKNNQPQNGEGLNALPILFVFHPHPALSHKGEEKKENI
jgi:hypothetical protein